MNQQHAQLILGLLTPAGIIIGVWYGRMARRPRWGMIAGWRAAMVVGEASREDAPATVGDWNASPIFTCVRVPDGAGLIATGYRVEFKA